MVCRAMLPDPCGHVAASPHVRATESAVSRGLCVAYGSRLVKPYPCFTA